MDDHLDRFIAELGSSDGMARKRAREALVLAGRPAAPLLRHLLAGGDKRLRWEALKALAAIGDPGSLEDFVRFLDDPESDLRWLAATGLIRLGPRSVRPVLQALTDPKAPRGRLEMGRRVLSEFANDSEDLAHSLAPLMEVIGGNDQAVIAERAARALSDVDLAAASEPDAGASPPESGA
jgi:HEAT repeat protein